jgi:hypothetical protein
VFDSRKMRTVKKIRPIISVVAYRLTLSCGHQTTRVKSRLPQEGHRIECFTCVFETMRDERTGKWRVKKRTE